MLLERTIAQLNVGPVSPEIAEELGHLGYLQWLGALRGNTSYLEEAMKAYEAARPLSASSPAIALITRSSAAS